MMVRAETEFIDCCLLCVVLLIFCVVLTISTLQSNVMLQYNAQTETHQIRPPQNHYLFIFHVHVHEQSGRCVTCWQSILSIDVHELIKVFPYFRYYNCIRPWPCNRSLPLPPPSLPLANAAKPVGTSQCTLSVIFYVRLSDMPWALGWVVSSGGNLLKT